jgi:hypothetical protein
MGPRPVVGSQEPERGVDATPPGQMPDLRGLGAREALRTLTRIGMTPRMNGDGFVVEQSPEPGALLGDDDACVLTLGRRAVLPAGGPQH